MTPNEWLMCGFVTALTVAYFAMRRIVYRNGVWDGAYNSWRPDVRSILEEQHPIGSPKACQKECAEARRAS